MFISFLKTFYYFSEFVLFSFNILWDYTFAIPLTLDKEKKIIMVDVVGGSGKSTLGNAISRRYGHHHIQLDKCKFGPFWKRCSEVEFFNNFHHATEQANGCYIVEGTYSDPKLPNQQSVNDVTMLEADLVIWHNIPKYVAMWRKLFRSFKRAIGVIAQGAAKEKLHNVIEMGKKTYRTFDGRYKILAENWKYDEKKYKMLKWPYYYYVS